MISDQKVSELYGKLEIFSQFEDKDQKKFQIELLERYIKKLEKFDELNRNEVNKLILLLEYAIQSAVDMEERDFSRRMKALRNHAQRKFKVYQAGELQQAGIGSGIAIGMGIGVAIGGGTNNVGVGIPIGIAIGVAIGQGIGSKNESKAREEGRIL